MNFGSHSGGSDPLWHEGLELESQILAPALRPQLEPSPSPSLGLSSKAVWGQLECHYM